MPYAYLIGQKVMVNGKEGIVMECADKSKVKFADGTFGFFNPEQVEPMVEDTRLKAMPEEQVLMEPAATGRDPLAQPKRATDRGIGQPQNVLGKNNAY